MTADKRPAPIEAYEAEWMNLRRAIKAPRVLHAGWSA